MQVGGTRHFSNETTGKSRGRTLGREGVKAGPDKAYGNQEIKYLLRNIVLKTCNGFVNKKEENSFRAKKHKTKDILRSIN